MNDNNDFQLTQSEQELQQILEDSLQTNSSSSQQTTSSSLTQSQQDALQACMTPTENTNEDLDSLYALQLSQNLNDSLTRDDQKFAQQLQEEQQQQQQPNTPLQFTNVQGQGAMQQQLMQQFLTGLTPSQIDQHMIHHQAMHQGVHPMSPLAQMIQQQRHQVAPAVTSEPSLQEIIAQSIRTQEEDERRRVRQEQDERLKQAEQAEKQRLCEQAAQQQRQQEQEKIAKKKLQQRQNALNALQMPPSIPPNTPNVCTIAVRLPNGKRVMHSFLPDTLLADVKQWIAIEFNNLISDPLTTTSSDRNHSLATTSSDSNHPLESENPLEKHPAFQKILPHEFHVATSYPKKEYQDDTKTLFDLSISGRTLLDVKFIK